jgi:Domain of unknown function DUF11/Dolichyl-phosphate-mannose-protein mannosyltransferase
MWVRRRSGGAEIILPVHRSSLARRWSPLRAALAAVLVLFALVGWLGVTTVGREGADDAGEHLAYAQLLDANWSIPTRAENYEYSTPPLFQLEAIGAQRAAGSVSTVALELPWNLATRAAWLLLVALGIAAMTSAQRRIRTAGVGALGLSLLWGLDEALSLAKSEPWSGGRLIALACGIGLVLVTGLIARELWPGNTGRAVAAAAFAAAYPVVFRMSILFHPEAQFAFLCALAIFVVLRASRSGWPTRLGWALGALFGAAALTRQPAVLVIATLFAASLWIGRRSTKRFLVRAAVVTVLVAGPWWGYAYDLWHNPFQSNLVPRSSVMMPRQPSAFYFGAPVGRLVLHPYRPYFADDLAAKLHAELWSDWFGAIHDEWQSPTRVARVTASTQSVLGFFADALAIGGLVLLALPALWRVLRRRDEAPAAVGLAVLALLALASLSGFVTMLLRFPQQYDDPIKSSYLLFTTPCWAVFSVAAWSAIRKRHRLLHGLLVVVAGLYVVSYGADLGDALAQPSASPASGSFTDLSPSFQQTSPNEPLGTEIDFLTSVGNSGNQTAGNVVLTLRFSPGMRLLGLPTYIRGSGCTEQGTAEAVCDLDFLPGRTATYIRYAVSVGIMGQQTITASVSSSSPDSNPSNNTASYEITLAPG